MSKLDERGSAARGLFEHDDVDGVLSGSFYAGVAGAEPRPKRLGVDDRPAHYKVICISMYTHDLAKLDEMVDSLKARGLTKANRSALIRYALSELDLDRVPRGL
jgi:hypothetical protein